MELMTERAKYEQWLEDLEAKKDSTPTKVFDRVRHDYLSRLQSVVDKLKEHTAAMQEHARTLITRLRELEAMEQSLRDEQSESELRSQVGEISSAEWEAVSRKAQRELAKMKDDQDRVAADLNRIRELLGGEVADEAPKRSKDFDELEFLKSVVGTPATGGAAVTPVIGAAAVAPPNPAATTAKPPTPPAATVVPEPPKGEKAPEPAPAPKPKKDTPLKVTTQGEAPSALRTSGVVEQPKTLKCTECGAMNYPTEWYCERCGAELTVV